MDLGLLGPFTSGDALQTLGAGLLNMSQGRQANPEQSLMETVLAKMMLNKKQDNPDQESFEGTNPQYQLPNQSLTFQGGGTDLDRLVHAIGQLESSNKFSAIGPRTKSGDRAYGFSQVMGANIPSWTKEILGRAMTPQEYLASPEAQQAVTRARLGQYMKQYGNINDASSMWFSGRPMRGNNSRDITGTSVPQYIRTVNRYYGGG